MSVSQILNELDEKQKPKEDIEETQVVSVDLVTKKEIIQQYLEGKNKKDIGNQYGLSTRAVSIIIEGNSEIRLETEKKYLSTSLARENYRLSESKNKLLDFIDNTLDEVISDPDSLNPESKMKVLNNIAALFDKLSITARLNADKPTNITESRELKVDVAKIMEQLQTPEDKLNFLRRQSTSEKINKPIYDGEVTTTE